MGEVILHANQLRTSADTRLEAPTLDLSAGFDRMDRVVGELQRRALLLRTTPLLRVMEQLPRLGRELAQHLGKRVEVELRGAELELDRSILDHLGDPLVHLLRNAIDHGVESPEERRERGKDEVGHVVVHARRDKDSIRISVQDDGAGLDFEAVRERAVTAGLIHGDLADDLPPAEIASLVFRPGLSTARSVSEISGRGVGMDAVRATIEGLGGRVELESRPGLGTTTSLVVPVTAAIQRVLLVGLATETVALPIAKIERIVEVAAEHIERSGNESFAIIDDEPILVIDLAERLGLPGDEGCASVQLALAEIRDQRVALRVQRLEGQQEIYVKPVPGLLTRVRVLSGLTVLGDGRPIFLVDPNQLV